MKIFSSKMVEQDVLEYKICNMCGKQADAFLGDIETLSYDYGYMGDDCFIEFELCEECINKIIATFIHPPAKFVED